MVRELFSHRRKTIKKALKTSSSILGIENVNLILEGISGDILKKRPEELTLEEFSIIANIIA
jgi:16S rRNA (adenine1518-N6/adenine1519-N6)-dimethyltransferase